MKGIKHNKWSLLTQFILSQGKSGGIPILSQYWLIRILNEFIKEGSMIVHNNAI